MDAPSRYFFDLDKAELEALVTGPGGMPRYRADQILQWVYTNNVTDPQKMVNISKLDRQAIERLITFTAGRVATMQRATDNTTKLLIDWTAYMEPAEARVGDGSSIPLTQLAENGVGSKTTECVMIPAVNPSGQVRRTAC